MSAKAEQPVATDPRIALIGNPNAGKSALFNALTGLRAKTGNFPGITVDIRVAKTSIEGRTVQLLDLPGLYGLDAQTPEEQVTADVLRGEGASRGNLSADVVVLVLDATNLARNLFLASEVLDLRHPTVCALNLIDAASREGTKIDVEGLSRQLGCPVIPVSARTGEGLESLQKQLGRQLAQPTPNVSHESCIAGCSGCTFAARYDWAERVTTDLVEIDASRQHDPWTAAIDRVLTHKVAGIAAFLIVMLAVFYLIFSLAGVPMTLIEEGFVRLGGIVDAAIPSAPTTGLLWRVAVTALGLLGFAAAYKIAGVRLSLISGVIAVVGSVAAALLPADDFRSLIVDGVIGGVGGVLVFLPQICILFFFIALLEDSGYLARAAFVMERAMRFVGLPGKAFVPMLSAHACAIPGIMAARVIENWRDRLVTILVLPLLTCSARLPVYGMLALLLFRDQPARAAFVFLGAYCLGIAAALLSAFCLKFTLLRGEPAPLVLELPPYRRPSMKSALLTVMDRGSVFVRNAGSVILVISIVLWSLATYPKLPEEARATHTSEREAAQASLAHSYAGQVGQAFEPVFRPLGFDWKINVGVISSFAAREVIVSSLAIIYGIGEEGAEDKERLTATLQKQQRADGTPVYDRATCYSLLVFYVLAMQCLPTQAVTRRETGSTGWAVFQLVYMTGLAYLCAWLTYQAVLAFN